MNPTGSPSALPPQIMANLRDMRLQLFSPFIIGGWLDTVLLGLVAVTVGQWMYGVCATDRRSTKVLVAYLILASLATTTCTLVHWHHVFLQGYGDFGVSSTTSGTSSENEMQPPLDRRRTQHRTDPYADVQLRASFPLCSSSSACRPQPSLPSRRITCKADQYGCL